MVHWCSAFVKLVDKPSRSVFPHGVYLFLFFIFCIFIYRPFFFNFRWILLIGDVCFPLPFTALLYFISSMTLWSFWKEKQARAVLETSRALVCSRSCVPQRSESERASAWSRAPQAARARWRRPLGFWSSFFPLQSILVKVKRRSLWYCRARGCQRPTGGLTSTTRLFFFSKRIIPASRQSGRGFFC